MTDPQFRNDASQKEREAVLRNDQRHTFQSRAIAEADDVRGRWAEINKSNVIGATPTVQYPIAAPNWSVDPVGIEPSLGHAIDAMEPVGEVGEVQASLDATTEAVVGQSQSAPLAGVNASAARSLDTGAAPTAVGASPADGEPPAIPTPKRRGLRDG